jgi:ABC-type oligopeptide transport system substrate-binding subunit
LKKLFLLLAAFALVFGLTACKPGEDDPLECEAGYELNEAEDECVMIEVENELPSIAGADDITLFIGNAFDPTGGVTATDTEDGDLTADVAVTSDVDLTTAGTYTVTYTVTDSDGGVATVTRTVVVEEADLVYPTGFYNYKFATTDLRHTFMAAAEKYLMNNMYGGVPLFASGSFALYSPRLQLPVDSFVAVMGYGTRFGTMSADDSTVLMEDGELGNAGEYTYRTQNSTNPVTFNQWIYDTSTDSTYMGEYYGALYDYVFNADKTGYEVIPVMADAQPEPQNPEMTETGKEVATIWNISIRDGLEWSYFGGTAPAYVTDNVIDANDFVDTYEIALTEQWFRAISGGGDFLTDTQAIVNAQEFVDGEVEWSEVGITVVDNLTIQFEFVNDMSEWNVKYWLSSFVMAPIHTEMYEELTPEDGETSYGTSPSTIAYHGPYVITAFEEDIILRLEKNDNYALPDLDFYTHKTFKIIEDTEIAFQTFVDGQLEAIGLPTEKYEDYKNHPGLKRIPGATTYRIMINGLGTVEAQRELFPDGEWIPEPILANQDFKMAMFHALDRRYLAEDVLKTRSTNMYLFSGAYMVDPEKGVPYRDTEQGQTVGVGLSPSTNGFNFDAAQALFESAVAAEIAAGNYVAGTEANPTIITIEFNYFSGSDSQVTMYEYIEDAFEAAFVDETNWVTVELAGFAKDFPDIYYDYMMIGEFDLSIGGISGSTLDAASFLDTYASDNRSGFTLNWGIDTSVAEINVVYNDFEGVRHNEMWSFDAIHSALNGEVYLSEGAEAIVPAAKDFEYTPTTVSFTVDQFDNDDFVDFTYSLEYYDLDAGYLPVEGHQEVPITAADVLIEGLLPFFYGYVSDGTILYQGDYQVTINFGYALDDTKEGSSTAPWWESGVLAELTRETTQTTATLGITLNEDDMARTVAELAIFEEQEDESMLDVTADLTVTDNGDGTYLVEGLTSNTWYVAEFTTSDDLMTWRSFTTTKAFEDLAWATWMADWNATDASFEVVDGVLEVDVVNVGDDNWNIQLFQEGLAFVQDTSYRITFDAMSSVARDINVKLIAADATEFTCNIALTTEMVTYTCDFTFNIADQAGKLDFELGAATNGITVGVPAVISFDNVMLEELDENDAVVAETDQIVDGMFE